MARLSNTFEFVGTLRFGRTPVEVRESESGWIQKSLKVSVNETNNNGVFITLQGGLSRIRPNKVFTFTKNLFGQKGSMLEVAWENRMSDSVLNSTSDFKKIVVDLTEDADAKAKYWELRKEISKVEQIEAPTAEDRQKLAELYVKIKEACPDRKEFLHPLDAVEFIESKVEEMKGKRFRVRGSIDISHWNGKFYTNYTAQTIELVTNDEIPNKLSATVDLFFGKDAVDKSLWNKEQKLLFDTYILCYDRDYKQDKLFPYQTVLNGDGFDFEGNPKHKAYLGLINKIFTTKSKVVSHIPFDVKVMNGSEEVEFDVKQLTDEQRLLVDAGLATIDEFKTRVFGDKVTEVQLKMPILKDLEDKGNFKTGSVESEFTPEDLVYKPMEKEWSKPKEEVKETKTEDTSLDLGFDEDDLPF